MISRRWLGGACAVIALVGAAHASRAQEVHWDPNDDPDGRVVDVCASPRTTVDFAWTGGPPYTEVSALVDGAVVATHLDHCSLGSSSGSCEFDIPSGKCVVGVQVRLHACPGEEDLWTQPAHMYTRCGATPAACTPYPTCEDRQKAGQCVAQPIDVTTGNVWYVAEDARATSGDVVAAFGRRYDSEHRSRLGHLGYGFRHTWEETLECVPAWNNRQTCVYNNARGDRWTCVAFTLKTTGFGQIPVNFETRFSCDGPIHLDTDVTGGVATIEERDGTRHTFEPRYFGAVEDLRLTQIVDRRGNRVDLAWVDDPALPHINVFAGPFHYLLDFVPNLGNTRRLDSVRLPDFNRVRFSYRGGGNDHLHLVRRVLNAGPPEMAQITEYLWEADPLKDPNLLRSVRDGAGHVLESWNYDPAGRGVHFVREGGVEEIADIRYFADHTVVEYADVVNPLSATPEEIDPAYFTVDPSRKVVTTRTGPCTECPGRVEMNRNLTWDSRRPIITSIRDGENRLVEYTRESSDDARRKWNITEIREAEGPLQRRTEVCYDKVFNVPVLVETETVGSCDPDNPLGAAPPCHGASIEADHMTITRKLNGAGDVTDIELRGCRGKENIERTWTIGYDTEFRLKTIGSARPEVVRPVTLEYGSSRNPTAMRVPLDLDLNHDLVWQFTEYDAMGRLKTMRDPNLTETRLLYDPLGNLEHEIRQDASAAIILKTSYTYDYANDGLLSTITRPNQQGAIPPAPWSLVYDGAHRQTDRVDPLGNVARSIYDSRSRVRRSELLEKVGIDLVARWYNEFDWDDFSRLVVRRYQTTALGGASAEQSESFSWDGTGRMLSSEDAVGDVTHYRYDDLGRLELVRQFNPGGQLVAEHELGYDVHDNISRISPPNRLPMVFEHGDDGALLATDLFDSGRTVFDHDFDGNLIGVKDARGIDVTRTFDWMGRPTAVVYPDSSENITYRYDEAIGTGCYGKGRLTSMTDPTNPSAGSPVQFCYDAFGRLKWESRPGFGYGTTSFSWDGNDNLTGVSYPFTIAPPHERRSVYEYDNADQVREVRVWYGGSERKIASEIEHLPFGPVRKLKLFDPLAFVVRERAFDMSYRVFSDQITLSVPLQPPDVLFERSYGYDPHGFLVDVDSLERESSRRHFAYDAQHQIVTADASKLWGSGTYHYDEAGNRTKRELDGVLAFVYGDTRRKNRVTQVLEPAGGPVDIGYDLRGNVTNYGSSTFSYTGDGQLKTVQHGMTSFATYLYDAASRARRIQQPGGWPQPSETAFLNYANGHELLEEVRQPGKTPPVAWLAQSYVWLDGEPLARVDSRPPAAEELYLYLTDHLGTPVEMLKDGFPTQPPSSTWAGEYEAFGEIYPVPAGPPATLPEQDNRLRFLGQRYDDVGSRLYQNWHRDYDPRMGRYRQVDPLWVTLGADESGSPGKGNAAEFLYPRTIARSASGYVSTNPYAYVSGNPIQLGDPRGLCPQPDSPDAAAEQALLSDSKEEILDALTDFDNISPQMRKRLLDRLTALREWESRSDLVRQFHPYRKQLRDFFKEGVRPDDVPREALKAYRELARRAIAAGKDAEEGIKAAEQARRLKLLDDLLGGK